MAQWRWTIDGSEESRGTLRRSLEDSGMVEAETLGDAMIALCEHGEFWDALDDDQSVTLTFEKIAAEDKV